MCRCAPCACIQREFCIHLLPRQYKVNWKRSFYKFEKPTFCNAVLASTVAYCVDTSFFLAGYLLAHSICAMKLQVCFTLQTMWSYNDFCKNLKYMLGLCKNRDFGFFFFLEMKACQNETIVTSAIPSFMIR